MEPSNTILASSFEAAALLRAKGFQFIGSRPGATGRIALEFADPEGAAEVSHAGG